MSAASSFYSEVGCHLDHGSDGRVYYWLPFMLGNAFSVETAIGVNDTDVCSEEIHCSQLQDSLT